MSEDLVKQPITWVDSNALLEQWCDTWRSKELLAFDTEFMRSRTYYPIAGLIQVNDGEGSYLIDPTAIDDFYPLIDILDSENILKCLHSCSEDLEVLQTTFGSLPNNIIDTQIAGAMAGYGYSVGFAKLVHAALGVTLPKGETRSDWLQRPLSQAQVHYAAIDVEYLYMLATHLLAELQCLGRLAWAREDSAALLANVFANQDPDKGYLRFKSAWKLESRQLAILQKLSRWREDMAQEKNVPRNRILKEPAMYAISQRAPTHLSQLRQFEGVNERMIRDNGNAIVRLVQEVENMPPEALPQALPKPLTAAERDLMSAMKEKVAGIAQSLSVPSELLVRKRDYEHLITGSRAGVHALPKGLLGWREALVGDVLSEMLWQ